MEIEHDPRIKINIRTGTSERPAVYNPRPRYTNFVFHEVRENIPPPIQFHLIPYTLYPGDQSHLNVILNNSLNSCELKKDETRVLSYESIPVSGVDLERQCGVCRENFTAGDQKTILPCAHYFHTPCLSEWVKYKPDCPFCREKI